jgi:hypothetical protein
MQNRLSVFSVAWFLDVTLLSETNAGELHHGEPQGIASACDAVRQS